MINVTPDEYINVRVDDQVSWYDQKSQRAQKWFKRFRIFEIISAGAIPLFAGFGGGAQWSIIIIGILGAVVAIIASLLSLNQFRVQGVRPYILHREGDMGSPISPPRSIAKTTPC